MYYSPRQRCFEYVEIRIAKQEDHDDLAGVFNSQSEVLTTQYGEFYLAELIACQNENQKALVAQVEDKAVGLMSISKDIDYKLLFEGFELEQYDNLLKSDYMEALKDRKDEIALTQQYQDLDTKRAIAKELFEEKMRSSHWGQRITLQQYLKTREAQALQEMEVFISSEENNKTLTRDGVEKMLDDWLSEFRLYQPKEIFAEQGVKDADVNCWVISERNFFLETLTYFGLPKDYLQGNGHWHDWAYQQVLLRKAALLRKQPRQKKQTKRTRARQEEKKEEEVKEPEYFDLSPLQKAFTKFMAAGPEMRTSLRSVILENLKKFILIFSNENGELIKERIIDVTELGDYMKEYGVNFTQAPWEYISYVLNCFGDLQFDRKVTKAMPQEEKTVREALRDVKNLMAKRAPPPAGKDAKKSREHDKKDGKEIKEAKTVNVEEVRDKEKDKEAAKIEETKNQGSPEPAKKEADALLEKLQAMVRPTEIIEMFSSFDEIMQALDKMRAYDQMMCRLDVIKEDNLKDPTLREEVRDLEEKERQEREEELRLRQRHLPDNPWRDLVQYVYDPATLPDIPPDVHNAIAINLFCIDEKYESRSIDFLEYAFELFPDRDYIILTQPHIVNESILLQSFIQIPKKKNAIFDDVLYVFHRDALLASLISVRRTSLEDIQEAKFLYGHMSQAAQIENDSIESIKSLTSNKIAFTVTCEETVSPPLPMFPP